MAYKRSVKYIVWNEDWTGLTFVEEDDPTINNYDYALPIAYATKDTGPKKAQRLQGVDLSVGTKRVGVL
jgi:hypothetical protein